MDTNMATNIIMTDCSTKSITSVNKVIETSKPIKLHIMIVWKTFLSWILFKTKDPLKNPIDLQKNNTEYYVYLWPVCEAK